MFCKCFILHVTTVLCTNSTKRWQNITLQNVFVVFVRFYTLNASPIYFLLTSPFSYELE